MAQQTISSGKAFQVDGESFSLADMLRDNADDEGVCDWLRGARQGERTTFGGGAAAAVDVLCVEDDPDDFPLPAACPLRNNGDEQCEVCQ